MGTRAWQPIGTPALAEDGTLYAPMSYTLYALNIQTRTTNWVFEELYGLPVMTPNVGPDGTIYFGVNGPALEGSALYALHGSSPLADAAWPKFQQNVANSGQSPTRFDFYSPTARPLAVQWRFNGEPMAGATNEILQIERAQFADAGTYSVVISNQHGSATSHDAVLSVGYMLSAKVLGPGEVVRDVELAVYPSNTMVQLTAVPQPDRNFLGWTGSILSPGFVLSVNVRSNIELIATFQYELGDVKWSSPFDDAPAISASGILYAFSEGWIVAVDTTSGRRLWKNGYFDSWWAPPAVGRDGTVYVGNYGGHSIVVHDGSPGNRKAGSTSAFACIPVQRLVWTARCISRARGFTAMTLNR